MEEKDIWKGRHMINEKGFCITCQNNPCLQEKMNEFILNRKTECWKCSNCGLLITNELNIDMTIDKEAMEKHVCK